jgi:hypothetical protein
MVAHLENEEGLKGIFPATLKKPALLRNAFFNGELCFHPLFVPPRTVSLCE